VRGWSGGVGAKAVAGVEGVAAPVSGGVGLRLEAEAREVAAARRRTREGKSRREEERARPAAGCGARQRCELVGVALTGGPAAQCTHYGFQTESNRINFLFQTDSNLPQI
jgi:hypothetical protein